MGQRTQQSSLVALLHHPSFGKFVWWLFLLMSFIMVIHNLVFQSWGIGTFDSITR